MAWIVTDDVLGALVRRLVRRQERLPPALAVSVALHAAVLCCHWNGAGSGARPDESTLHHDPRRFPLQLEIRGMAPDLLPEPLAAPTAAAASAETPALTGQRREHVVPTVPVAAPSAAATAQGAPMGGGDDCRVTGFRFCSS